ncbi:putative DctQ (C4-dicarboxylate permease, small subunit) [Oceaniovalibus guishaninsula JLT2003]|uniref:TRAP transporter small permease protein n=1 Tax=Oceaniovalibus guishaninsula JLT2003 TaxID=1231392 RepID=K2I5U9_9RHOB|nr:TRAP transporter small permease [Oceaniovalibus guishaninsula]EKE44360.1 putative DctQ (C4-dicarboxylate permease, small subunit) [Oceaniovalibus guishaninsula JLT2003]
MRRALDTVYATAAWAAAMAVLVICLVVTAQVVLNVASRLGGAGVALTIPSYADFAGFALAAATFLALAPTLRAGVHIRVNLAVMRLPTRLQWVAELIVLALGTAMAAYATWFAGSLLQESRHYGDMSTGIVAVPIWIPQIAMVAGLGLLTVALLDTLVESLRRRTPILKDAAEA